MVRYASSRIGFLLLLLGAADDADGEDDAMMIGVSYRVYPDNDWAPGETVRPSLFSCDCQNDSKKRKRNNSKGRNFRP